MEVLGVVALYVAGVIGAGFASGQELAVFFVNYGRAGLLGMFLAIVVLTGGTILILEHAAKHRVTSYEGFFASFGRYSALFFDGIYTFFLIVGSSVMLAGSAALGGTLLIQILFRYGTAFLIFLVMQRGITGTLKSSTLLAPFIVFTLFVLALVRLVQEPIILYQESASGALEAGLLYASYNLGFSVAVLASIQSLLKTRKQIWLTGVVGNLALGGVMIVLYFALLGLPREALGEAFPLLWIAKNMGLAGAFIYRIVLWAAMYTTALAHSFSLVKRLSQGRVGSWTRMNILVTLSSLALSHLGFRVLIETAYPFLGLLGLWILATILHLRFRRHEIA